MQTGPPQMGDMSGMGGMQLSEMAGMPVCFVVVFSRRFLLIFPYLPITCLPNPFVYVDLDPTAVRLSYILILFVLSGDLH